MLMHTHRSLLQCVDLFHEEQLLFGDTYCCLVKLMLHNLFMYFKQYCQVWYISFVSLVNSELLRIVL